MVATTLISTAQQIRTAREHRAAPPYDSAWNRFETLPNDNEALADAAAALAYDAFRWPFMDDADAAERAVTGFEGLIEPALNSTLVDEFQRTFALAQALACLDDYPMYQNAKPRLLDAWSARLTALTSRLSAAPHERAWAALLTICKGMLLNRQEMLDFGAQHVRDVTDRISAHGYITGVVEGGDGSLERTLQAVQALCLAGEAGANAGLDLWGYERRGVSIMTAAMYPLYYYYYPEKWPWDSAVPFDPAHPPRQSRRERRAAPQAEIELEPTQTLFRQHPSFLEIVNLRTAGKVRAVTMILDELRPIVDLLGGGPVTLTHALPPPPKRRGLFGR